MSQLLYSKPVGFLLNAAIALLAIMLLLPFFASTIYTTSSLMYGDIFFDHLHVYWVSASLLCAIPMSYLLFRKTDSFSKRKKLIRVQLLLVLSLAALFYVSLDTLNEIMYRPFYQG